MCIIKAYQKGIDSRGGFMRITQEADYALRIVSLLAQKGLARTPEIAESVKVPHGFAMKILRKLVNEGIVCSHRGVNGGYELLRSPNELTVSDVIESVDGEIAISKCLSPYHNCLNNPDKSRCRYHHVFRSVNGMIKEKLSRLTIGMMVNAEIPLDELIKIIN